MDINISRVSEGDLDGILRLQKLAYVQEAEIYGDFTIAPLTQTIEELTAEAKSSLILKAVLDGRLAGSVRAYEKQGTCHIGRLIVHPEYQNKGIGKKLMKAVEDSFKACRYELFTGHRSEKNLAFYKRLGYKQFDVRKINDKLQFVYLEKKTGGLEAGSGPEAGSIDAYRRFALYYDTYVGGFKEDIPLYLSLAGQGTRILEVGCGTGRVLRPLLDSGCIVTGIDISPDMLEVARDRLKEHISSSRLQLMEHNLCEGSLPYTFDRAFVTFYTFNYLLEKTGREQFVRSIYSMLEPGGIAVFDLFYPSPLAHPELDDKWTEKVFSMDGRKIVLQDKRRMDGDVEERVQRYISEAEVDEIVTRRRYFTKDYMLKLLCGAGFVNVRFANGYDIKKLECDEAKGSFIVVAEK